jgi:glutamyl-tRNA synthetase
MNNQYLQKMGPERFARHLRDQVFTDEALQALAPFALERLDRLDQFVDRFGYFFNGALNYDGVPLVPTGKTPADISGMLSTFAERLDDVYEWTHERLHQELDAHRAALGWKPKDFFMTVRMVVTGRKDSPPLAESMALIGREIVRFRLREALKAPQLA